MHERTSGEFYERNGECIKMPNRKAEEALDDHSSPGSDICSSSSESLDFLPVTDLESAGCREYGSRNHLDGLASTRSRVPLKSGVGVPASAIK